MEVEKKRKLDQTKITSGIDISLNILQQILEYIERESIWLNQVWEKPKERFNVTWRSDRWDEFLNQRIRQSNNMKQTLSSFANNLSNIIPPKAFGIDILMAIFAIFTSKIISLTSFFDYFANFNSTINRQKLYQLLTDWIKTQDNVFLSKSHWKQRKDTFDNVMILLLIPSKIQVQKYYNQFTQKHIAVQYLKDKLENIYKKNQTCPIRIAGQQCEQNIITFSCLRYSNALQNIKGKENGINTEEKQYNDTLIQLTKAKETAEQSLLTLDVNQCQESVLRLQVKTFQQSTNDLKAFKPKIKTLLTEIRRKKEILLMEKKNFVSKQKPINVSPLPTLGSDVCRGLTWLQLYRLPTFQGGFGRICCVVGVGQNANGYQIFGDNNQIRDVFGKISHTASETLKIFKEFSVCKKFNNFDSITKLAYNAKAPSFGLNPHSISPILVLDIAQGFQTIFSLIPTHNFSVPESVRIVHTLVNTLHDAYIIDRRLHLDISDGNVLYNIITGKSLLIDWGASIQTKLGANTAHIGCEVGSPNFISPEARLGTVSIGSDIFSLGLLFYELIHGAYLADGMNDMTEMKFNLTVNQWCFNEQDKDIKNIIFPMIKWKVSQRPNYQMLNQQFIDFENNKFQKYT